MHEDQLPVDAAVVQRLVAHQFPQWRHLAVRRIAGAGTMNAIFRLGDGLAARLPLRAKDPRQARAELEAELSAAREFAAASPVPAPVPVAVGEPGDGYPLPWSVQTWVAGAPASSTDLADSRPFARDLAHLVASLRSADTHGRRFSGQGRGGHLPDHDEWMHECFDQSRDLLDVPRLQRVWHDLRTLPHPGVDVMTHGDVIPQNLLVDDQRLAGVLDGGGFGPADPALDLIGAWHVLNHDARTEFRHALGIGPVEWQRGMAWAFQQSMGLVWYYVESDPALSQMGRRTLDQILAEMT